MTEQERAERCRRELEELASRYQTLPPEQIFDRLNRLLPLADKALLVEYAQVIAGVIPELKPTVGFDQHSPHHAYDLYTHIAYVTQAVPGEPVLRWAALLHDIGKIPAFTQDETGRGHFRRHPQLGAEMAREVLRRMGSPEALRQQVAALILNHMIPLQADPWQLRRLAETLGMDTLRNLVILQQADMASKGVGSPDTARYREILGILG